MSKSTKRTFSEMNGSSNDKGRPSKKLKMDISQCPIRTMFNDDKDNRQYLSYFAHISDSELSQTMNIPAVINQEIAQFATGTIQKCEECKLEFNALNEDVINYQTKSIKKLSYCSKTDKYFCELCSKQTFDFDCCGTVQCVKSYQKCTWLDDDEKGHCHNTGTNESFMAYRCPFCVDDDEEKCDCGKWHCEYHKDFKSYCEQCRAEFCMDMFRGLTCNECYVSMCDDCLDKNRREGVGADDWYFCNVGVHVVLCGNCWDGVTCKGCKSEYCSHCFDLWQNMGDRALREKHCKICNGYFCARHGCYGKLNKDDICKECVERETSK